MMSVPNDQPERTFDAEELQTTLRKLQQAMGMVSRVRRNLEQEEGAVAAYGGMHSGRIESWLATCSRNLGSVSAYVDDERACYSSRSLRFSTSSDDHIAQPRRAARSPNLIAKLMGLEETPMYISGRSEISVKCEICAQTAVSKGVLENNGDEGCKNIPSSFGTSSSQISEEMTQILSRRGLERKEVRRREKPEARTLKNSVHGLVGTLSKQQQQRKMSKPLLRGKKLAAAKTEKEIIAGPTSEAKRSTRAPVRLDRSSLPKGANAPKRHSLATTRSKKEKEAKAARKSTDIIQVTAGRTTNNGVTGTNQRHASLVDTLPKHVEQNSKQCDSTGRRRKLDSKHYFCEAMVKTTTTVEGGRKYSISEASGEFRCHNKITLIQREDIKLLLLSSQSFINYAKELCKLDANNQTTAYHPKKGGGVVAVVVPTRNAKLLLDCARELVDRKSKYQSSNHVPISLERLSGSSSRAVVRVDELAEEIANEISKLEVRFSCRRRRGRRGDGEGLNSENRTYERLEMDLQGCNNVLLNAMWDQGWSEWICAEEVDYVVGPLEKMVLCGLVEELVMDLLL